MPAHGTAMLRIEGDSAVDKLRYQGEYAYMNKFSAIHPEENARFVRINNYTASGGCVMGWLGNSTDNWAEYRDVNVSRGGNYTFRLYYASQDDRNLTVTVNGTEYPMQKLNSGSYSIRATRDLQIQLNAGTNVIRLSNATGWAPDIDKFELIPEGGTTLFDDPFDIQTSVKTVLKPSDAKIHVSGNLLEVKGRSVQDVRLFAMNGQLACRKGDEPFSFIMPVSGSYLAVIRYYNDRQEAVKVVI